MAGVIPWSYSSLNAFETCPRRFYLTRIAKVVQEPQTTATAWGNAVHKALEDAVKGSSPLTERYATYQLLVDKLKTTPGQKFTERKFGITNGYGPTTFFAKNVWFRGVIDLTIDAGKTVHILDYKTGKVKEDGDQLKLFAAAGFAQHPHAQRIRTGYIWLAHDQLTRRDFDRDELPTIWQEFIPRVQRMENAQAKNDWPARPSGLCRTWCPVGKANCSHCGED